MFSAIVGMAGLARNPFSFNPPTRCRYILVCPCEIDKKMPTSQTRMGTLQNQFETVPVQQPDEPLDVKHPNSGLSALRPTLSSSLLLSPVLSMIVVDVLLTAEYEHLWIRHP